MRRFLQRVWGVTRRARDLFPITWLGLLVGSACALALFHYGLARIDLVLLIVGVVGLGLVALCFLLTTVAALVLWRRLRGGVVESDLLAECGYPRWTGFSLGTPWFLPFIRIGWGWRDPEVRLQQVRRGLRIYERIIPLRRTLRDDIVREFEVSDSFGLTRIRFPILEERVVRFAPSAGALKQMHVIRSMAAGDELSHPDGPQQGERMDMRHYSPGDPIRFVLWKVFARSREVVVRTPERAIGPVHQTVAYLVTGKADEPGAGAARVAVECGALGGDWVLGADGCADRAESSTDALELLARSANAPPEAGGGGLGSFLADATPGGQGRALVFVPARPGPWLERVGGAVRSRGQTAVEFVVCADGVDRNAGPRGWFRRYAYKSPGESADPSFGVGPASAEDVATVCKALAMTGARVIVLDRLHGRVYSEAHQRTLEARPEEAA